MTDVTINKRIDSIDVAKGIGIILVVFAHTIVPQLRENGKAAGFLWIFIYNFHMPLFFFLSGILFEKGLAKYTDKRKFILGKLKYLMLPYLTFSVFAYVFISIALKISFLAPILKSGGYSAASFTDALFQILTYNGHIDQHLWFVYSLFIVFVINILMPKITRSRVMLIVFRALYVSKAFVHYYGILDYTAGDFLFFSLARVMTARDIKPALRSPLSLAAVIAVFVTSGCIYSFFYVTSMPDGVLKALLYTVRAVSSVSGIITVYTLSERIAKARASKPLKEIGLYSYDIYLMHAPFLVSGSMGILLAYAPLPAPVCCAAVLVIGIALPYALSRLVIRKIPPLSVIILGKRYK